MLELRDPPNTEPGGSATHSTHDTIHLGVSAQQARIIAETIRAGVWDIGEYSNDFQSADGIASSTERRLRR